MNMQHTAQRCQSCGMPLAEVVYGTDKDGNPSQEYCKFCYHGGKFAEPNLTLDAMIERSVNHMRIELDFSRPRAEGLASAMIPMLKRWKGKLKSESRTK